MMSAELSAQAEAIRLRMQSYATAIGNLDATCILGHYVQGPEFRLISDGVTYTYDDMANEVLPGLRNAFRSSEVQWGPIEVTSLGPNAAIASTSFRRMDVNAAGVPAPVRGAVTWVWVRRGGEWRTIHGHGVHYPEPTAK
jgi:ketosteroid isomerase-like protein